MATVVGLALFAAACSQSNTPQTWAEAEADGNLRHNFIAACTEANAEGGDVVFSSAEASDYCTCSFEEIVEYFGGEIRADRTIVDVANAVDGRDFDAFKDLESDLRSDPERIPGDIEGMLTGCALQASG